MRLLLLLSALLAALSGAGASARAPQAQVVEAAVRLAAPQPARAHAHVLAAARPARAVAAEVVETAPEPIQPVPPRLWMLRRRE